MRTRNRVIILLILALAGSFAAAEAGQDSSTPPQQTAESKLPESRFASCIVRITADPVILPLDPATVQGLLRSSGVAGAAVRDVLHRDSIESPWEELIEMEWLNESLPGPSPAATALDEPPAAQEREMLQQLESIYGAEYMRQIGTSDSPTRDRRGQSVGGSPESRGRYRTRVRETSLAARSPQPAPIGAPGATIRLSVYLPEDMPPVADRFLTAVTGNLRMSLSRAYEAHVSNLNGRLSQAKQRYEYATDLEVQEGGTDAVSSIMERLDTVVDLSALTPETPLGETVEILRKSVAPSLNIVVLWTDLMDSLGLEQATPINIDGMPHIQLGTALDLLVTGLPSAGVKPAWRIRGDAIVVATAVALDGPAGPAGHPIVETDIRALAAQRDELSRRLQDLDLDLTGQEARRQAIAEQIHQARRQTEERLDRDEVIRELARIVQLNEQTLSDLRNQPNAGLVSPAELARATENLARARIELAKRREELSRQVGGTQLEQFNGEMSRIAIDRAEKEARRDMLRRQLARVQQQVAQAFAFDPEAARMRMARETLDILSRRITELQTHIANLQRPMVTVVGAN